jgi:hypothetical protein
MKLTRPTTPPIRTDGKVDNKFMAIIFASIVSALALSVIYIVHDYLGKKIPIDQYLISVILYFIFYYKIIKK